MVVAETWDPGWRATVNGEPAPVEPVDGVLMGVSVPPGPGALALTYRPQGIVWGTALTLLGFAACGLGFAVRSGVGIAQAEPDPRRTDTGSSRQISRLYSATVRSDENPPLAAALSTLDRLHASGSR